MSECLSFHRLVFPINYSSFVNVLRLSYRDPSSPNLREHLPKRPRSLIPKKSVQVMSKGEEDYPPDPDLKVSPG